jgi:integrase
MRPDSRSPFTLYKKPSRSGSPVWYARFWDAKAARWGSTRSTGIEAEGKRERKAEAIEAARAMLPGIRFAKGPADSLLLDYARDFWTPGSPYVRDRALVAHRPLSAAYVKMNHDDVDRHLRPFPKFRGLLLGDLRPGHIQDWMRWAAERGLSSRRINAVLQGLRVAVRWAVNREEIPRDPFAKIGQAREESREKGILSAKEVTALIALPVSDPRGKVGALMAALCGLRRGECRGALWGDLDRERRLLYVRHNIVPGEKAAKGPKGGSARTVPVSTSLMAALDELEKVSPSTAPEAPIIFSLEAKGGPVSEAFLPRALAQMLEAIGIDRAAQKARRIGFHSLRHTFVTLGRLAGISDLEIQALAGHKSGAMMDRYSHAGQVLDFNAARERMEKAVGQ